MGLVPRWLYRRPYVEIKATNNSPDNGSQIPLLLRNGSPNNNWQCTRNVDCDDDDDDDDDDAKTKTTNLPVRTSTVNTPPKINDVTFAIRKSLQPTYYLCGKNVKNFVDSPDLTNKEHQRQNSGEDLRSTRIMVNDKVSPAASSVFTVQDLNRPNDVENPTDFETAIKLCGYGKFHYGFVFLCGMMFLCCGCQNGINAYILPSAECDLRLTSEDKGLLNVAFLVGGVVSSIFWGVFADAYGRKNILVGTLLVDGLLTFVSSFSQSFPILLAFRGISGFTIGAPGSLIYTYLGEFHAAKQRVKSICYVGFFWTLSWLILPGLAWIIIPMRIKWQYGDFVYNSWHLYLAITGLPTLLVAAVLTRYPESPKFLLSRGKSNEALEILRDVYASNVGRDRTEYPVKILAPLDEGELTERKQNNNVIDREIFRNNFGNSRNDSHCVGGFEHDTTKPSFVLDLLVNVYRQIQSLGSPPLFKWAILCWTIYFTNMFGYYGLGLWMPELFNRFGNYYKIHPNISVSVCELVEKVTISQQTFNCDGTSVDERVFINTLTINGVCLLGNVASGFFADRVGRRTIPVTTMLTAGFAGFAIYFVRSSSQNLIVACIYSLAIATANFVIGSVVVDIFPTHVGAVAICMMTFFGRIGAIASNLAFGMLLDISCEIPIFLVGGIVVFGGLLALLLPPAKR